MTHAKRLAKLATLGWIHDPTSGRHLVCGERCDWIDGKIGEVIWSAWIGEKTGTVYLHIEAIVPGEYDFMFETFCQLVANGWPEKKPAKVERSLFGDD